MRPPIIPFAIWLGVLQLPPVPGQGIAAVVTTASALAGLTVLVYRLGIWRAEMQNTKHNVGAEIARYREESRQDFTRLEGRFTAIDQFIAAATEQRVASERWQARTDSGLASLDRRLVLIERHEQAA